MSPRFLAPTTRAAAPAALRLTTTAAGLHPQTGAVRHVPDPASAGHPLTATR